MFLLSPTSLCRAPLLYLSLVLLSSSAAAAVPANGLDDAILDLTHRWARVNYKTPVDAQAAGFRDVITASERVAAAYPGRAEPLVWEAIACASDAKAEGGLDGLKQAKRARDLLLSAEKIDPQALNGSVYTSLGTLYANVPRWPIGFGDADQARKYFEQALQINPSGIDQHYFYGEYLLHRGEYGRSYEHLKQALAAPARPGREDSDAGRREDAQRLLNQLKREHGDQVAGL